MKLEIANFIISPAGRKALDELARQPLELAANRHLPTLVRLRKEFSSEEAGGLLEVAVARQRATRQAKWSRADRMFFTGSGFEQASGETIAGHRAARFRQVLRAGSRVADLGCGIGGDSLGLVEHFEVTGVDLDPARLVLAEANAAVYDRSDRFQTQLADLTGFDPAGYAGLFFDPARRTAEGRRLFSVEDYSPPLSIIQQWRRKVPELGVKISPGVKYQELEAYQCEIEIISEHGDVKEAVLWFGELRGPKVARRATLLPEGVTLVDQPDKPPVEISGPLAYLYEPDGAVIRAGLVEELALQLDARKIDPDIAYLTAANLRVSPFVRAFRILESQPFNLKKVNRRLQELEVGRVIIKKRGSPLEPASLEQALKLKGQRTLTLVLTHLNGVHSVIFCEPEPQP